MSQRRINPGHFSQDATDLLHLLHSRGVEFLLIGGEAVIYYGYPRFTGDIDLFYRCQRANCGLLYAALTDFWGGPVPVVRCAEELEEPSMVFQFGRPPNRVDLLSSVSGIDFAEAYAQREEALFESITVPYIGLSHLILSKRAAGRPKDLEDLRYLERLI